METEAKVRAILYHIVVRRQEDSGQRPLSEEIKELRAKSYERHLTNAGARLEDYEQIYELATQIYNKEEIRGPFGIDHLLQAAIQINKAREYNRKFPSAPIGEVRLLASRPSCEHCKGTKLAFRIGVHGENLGLIYETVDGKKKPKSCEYC